MRLPERTLDTKEVDDPTLFAISFCVTFIRKMLDLNSNV